MVVALCAAIAWLWSQPVVQSAGPGQQHRARLPDGSVVELNSGTKIAYQRSFQTWPLMAADTRSVRLDGEAFFRVEPGSRPFVVETASAQVEVVGTQFNVWARNGETPATEVVVAEGRVRVVPQGRPERASVLGEKMLGRVQGRSGAVATRAIDAVGAVLAWRENGFVAREEPLNSVVRELERRYDTSVRLHRSVEQPEAPVSLYYPGPVRLKALLKDLCTALDLRYRATEGGYEVLAPEDTLPNDAR
jgi:ferric-dicitrate binding protein FerR (iron transport regulator)